MDETVDNKEFWDEIFWHECENHTCNMIVILDSEPYCYMHLSNRHSLALDYSARKKTKDNY